MTREEAILWMQVLKHSKINWVGEQAEDEDIIARCEEAEQEAFDMAIEALSNDITESPNDVVESQNDVIEKPRTVRYKLHKPIEYVSIEFDEEEEITQIGHYTAYGERREP